MQKKSIKVSACFLTHLRKSNMANKITGRLMEMEYYLPQTHGFRTVGFNFMPKVEHGCMD